MDYIRKDSLQRRRESKAYRDSIDREPNRLNPIDPFTGYAYRKRAIGIRVGVDGLTSSLLFNSVEGLVMNYGVWYIKQIETVMMRTLAAWAISGMEWLIDG